MIDVQVEVIGDKVTALNFRDIPPRAALRLETAIGRVTLQLLRRTKQKLSDDVLHVQTGRLRRSITQQVTRTETEVVGTVGTNVKYAAAHEFGFEGTVTVKEHLRQIRDHGEFKLFKSKGSEDRLGVYRKVQGKLTGGVATVRAHERHVKLPERSFLRSALEDLHARGIPLAEIEKAIAGALK